MLDVVRQDTNWSCFAASLAMVTGIDYDLMDKSDEAAPTVFPMWGGRAVTLEPLLSDCDIEDEFTTIFHWQALLEDNGYTLRLYDEPVLGLCGVLSFTVVEEPGKHWSHAVAIDESGYAVCPSAMFDGTHLTGFMNSCNLMIAGFVTAQEK